LDNFEKADHLKAPSRTEECLVPQEILCDKEKVHGNHSIAQLVSQGPAVELDGQNDSKEHREEDHDRQFEALGTDGDVASLDEAVKDPRESLVSNPYNPIVTPYYPIVTPYYL